MRWAASLLLITVPAHAAIYPPLAACMKQSANESSLRGAPKDPYSPTYDSWLRRRQAWIMECVRNAETRSHGVR